MFIARGLSAYLSRNTAARERSSRRGLNIWGAGASIGYELGSRIQSEQVFNAVFGLARRRLLAQPTEHQELLSGSHAFAKHPFFCVLRANYFPRRGGGRI